MEENSRKESPLVSICIPAYNAEAFVEKTIESLLKQTYPNIEILVTDDGSSDKTVAILEGYNEARVKVFKQKNKGAGAARNNSFNKSRGFYIKFMDADDLLNAEAIEHQVELAEQNAGSIISGKWGRFYNDDLATFAYAEESVWRNMPGLEWIIESWKKAPNMTQPGIFLIPRSTILQSGLWIEELSRGSIDDMEFFTKMILNSKGVVFCKDSTLFYRSGIAGSLSKKKDRIGYEKAFRTVELSAGYLLSKSSNAEAKKAAANQLQVFAYDSYPQHKDLYKKAKALIDELGGSDLKFDSGGYTKVLSNLFGWKATKQVKYLSERALNF